MKRIHRYWVDFINEVEREWDELEYAHHNPNIPIVEKHWYNHCPVCGAYQGRALSKKDAIQKIHKCFGCLKQDGKMRGYGFKDFEFRCLEVGVNHIESFDCDVTYEKFYPRPEFNNESDGQSYEIF